MELLATNTISNASFVTAQEVISFSQESPRTLIVVVRLELGNETVGIAGNGTYTISVFINNKIVVPINSFNIPAGVTNAYSVSREIVLESEDLLTIKVTGQAGDTNTGATASIYDVTPAVNTDFGAVLVDHDYPTDGAMTLLDGANAPIVGACIYIYLASDYSAHNTAPEFIVGKSVTIEGGVWKQPVALNAGDYVAYFFKQGTMNPTTISFTVTP
jgi:hypothetical protein